MEHKQNISLHTTPKAYTLLKKRYRFEKKFKFAGLAAICLAILALLTLLYTIVEKVADIFTESYIVLDVKYEPETLLSKGPGSAPVKDPSAYSALWKKSLKNEFPAQEGGRKILPLYGLVSDAAALEMRSALENDPALIGTTQQVYLLADDAADLYLKGRYGKLENIVSQGTIKPEATEGKINVFVEPGSMAQALSSVKASLEQQAKRAKRQAKAQDNGVVNYQKRLNETSASLTEEEKTRLQNGLSAFISKRDALLQEAARLEQKANSLGGSSGDSVLTTDIASFFVKVHDGIIKIDTLKADHFEGTVFIPLKSTDAARSGQWQLMIQPVPETARKISDRQVIWLEHLKSQGKIEQTPNFRFLTASFSREAEQVGVWGALVGSCLTMMVTLLLALPIGVIAAIYLEEFAPKNWFTNFVEVSINNLAAVPSIIFGLLGLAFIIGVLKVERSTPLAGGIVLALLILPTIIIAARAAIKAVPPSIRQAALGLGASKNQTVFHHVLPLAMPGIMTGTIIGMAHALGETAPLLMVGMKAFVVDIPTGITSPATAMPVQIYLMSDFPEIAFQMKTAASILVLLVFLVIMNAVAIFLRQKFERKW